MTEPAPRIWPLWAIPFALGIGGAIVLILLAEHFPALQVIYTVF